MPDTDSTDKRQIFQDRLGYAFQNAALLDRALTHSSLRDGSTPTYERLEFLGDAVLGMVISEHLFRTYDQFDEGALTRVKSVVVSARTLASKARELGFLEAVRVGKGLAQSPLPDSLLADAFEAVIAALYLDGGLESAREFILRHLQPEVRAVLEERHEKNFKSLLQNLAQRYYKATPRYTVVSEEGPDHVKVFEVAACIGWRKYPPGKGRNKKEAEQRAAENAYDILSGELTAGSLEEKQDSQ
jgi:ribonuclease-3